jgi:hypothetical protein
MASIAGLRSAKFVMTASGNFARAQKLCQESAGFNLSACLSTCFFLLKLFEIQERRVT